MMKNMKGVLLVMGALSLGMVAVAPVAASTAVEQSWVWSGAGVSYIDDANFFQTDADDFFNLVVSGQSYKLIREGHRSEVMTLPAITIGAWTVPLQYGFSFTDGTETYYTYSVEQISTTSYVLRNSDTGMAISYQGRNISYQAQNVPPSAVPIPGAALLLGSGLMGILGIGRSKKKKQLV